MNQTKMLQALEERKLVPVVKLDRVEDAKPLAEALCKGGLPVAEVTFRTDAAEESIRIMKEEFPDMLVGAGTVVNAVQAQKALDAGASFLVSPGTNREVIEFAIAHEIPIFPGCCTPSEVMTAMGYGLEVVKFFPAEPAGGLKMIKAMAAPYTGLKFMPTGGINATNVKEYLAYDKILACGGSWMVKGSLVEAGEFDKIEAMTKEAVEIVKEVRG